MSEEPKEYTMTLHVADRKMNDFMKCFDLRADFKWFIESKEVTVTTTTVVDEKYIRTFIETSKQDWLKGIKRSKEDFWIPAITYLGKLYKDPDVKILSDGVREYLVGAGESLAGAV
jgi:hypothetical protein